MRFDKNTGKTIAFACVILFAGILFSTWVLPAATEDKSEQAVVMPVTLNNPQKIIESPAMKADPQKLYPAAYSLREPLNTSQIDETVVQARNLFLKNVSEDVEYLFTLKAAACRLKPAAGRKEPYQSQALRILRAEAQEPARSLRTAL